MLRWLSAVLLVATLAACAATGGSPSAPNRSAAPTAAPSGSPYVEGY